MLKVIKNRIKVDNLKGIELDYWVVKSEGLNVLIDLEENHLINPGHAIINKTKKAYTIDWNFIGEIIEKLQLNGVDIELEKDVWGYQCSFIEKPKDAFSFKEVWACVKADSSIEAIKKCIVKRKYGEYPLVMIPLVAIQFVSNPEVLSNNI